MHPAVRVSRILCLYHYIKLSSIITMMNAKTTACHNLLQYGLNDYCQNCLSRGSYTLIVPQEIFGFVVLFLLCIRHAFAMHSLYHNSLIHTIHKSPPKYPQYSPLHPSRPITHYQNHCPQHYGTQRTVQRGTSIYTQDTLSKAMQHPVPETSIWVSPFFL